MRTTVVATLTGVLLVARRCGWFHGTRPNYASLGTQKLRSARCRRHPPLTQAPPLPNETLFNWGSNRLQRSVPQGTSWVRCVRASFRSGNRMWIVTCEYRENRDDRLAETARTYLFDDRTGKLSR